MPVKHNPLHDGHGSPAPDGRVLVPDTGVQHTGMLCIASLAAHWQCSDSCLASQGLSLLRSEPGRERERGYGGQVGSQAALAAMLVLP